MSKYLTRESKNICIIPAGQAHHNSPELYSDCDGSACSGEAWKLDVGAECNLLLDRAQALEMNAGRGRYTELSDQSVARAIRSIAARVAEFEELETE